MSAEFTAFMKPFVEKLGLPLTEEQLYQFDLLGKNMLADSMYPSVSKIFSPEEIAMKHFLDSILPLKFAPESIVKALKVLDLGTGGGFPLLPLAIMFPDKKFLGVDSRQKSVEFVARMAQQTGLNNVSVEHSRIEELGQNPKHREKYDLVVCRALSAICTLLEYTLPLTRVEGFSFYFKGPKLDEELKEAANAMKVLGVAKADYQLWILEEEFLPFSRGYMQVHKKQVTPNKYPRKNGLPTAKPL